MKKDFTNENFENFLKQSADSLRMKAPDKVWQNLSKELSKRRRRSIGTGLSILLLALSTGGYFYMDNAVVEQNRIRSKAPLESTSAKPATSQALVLVTPAQQPNYKASSAQASSRIQTTERTLIPLSSTSSFDKLLVADKQSLPQLPETATNLQAPAVETTVVDAYDPQADAFSADAKSTKEILRSVPTLDPLSIESVVNTFQLKLRKNRLETQFYLTPTISYRKLTENKSYLLTAGAGASNTPAAYSSVNKEVTHKPDLGFEIGYGLKYRVSKKIKVKTSLQLNVNRYDVKAYTSLLEVATIALNTSNSIDSFNTVSRYSNIDGYKTNWLQNISFQASLPIGVELILQDKGKMQFGVAGTVQPTYILGEKAYLITTDYKSYTLVPWLTRQWNVNTALEAFVSYQTGKTRWQVGPQVRYQLLSSFRDEYPVKENLFDFGMKFGITVNK